MRQLAIDDHLGRLEQPGYQFAGVRPDGPCCSSLFAPGVRTADGPGDPGPRHRAALVAARPGDEVVYVMSGSLSAGDERCPTGGMLLIDEGAELHLRAESETVLLHFGRQGSGGQATPGARRRRVAWSDRPVPTPPWMRNETPASLRNPTRTSPPRSSSPGEPDPIDPSPTATLRTRSFTWPRGASPSAPARFRPAQPCRSRRPQVRIPRRRGRIRPVELPSGPVVLLGL